MNSEEIRPGLLLRFASRKALPLSCGSSLVAPVEGPEESLSGCGLRSLPGVPNGIRTRVAGLKGRRPRPG
jgi:hypothetical protein